MDLKKIFRSLLVAVALQAVAAEEDGFVPLFNGRDLDGWVNANCAPETWSVREGVIHCTGLPTGALRTIRQYENFIFELEWRHLASGGNAGIFIWATPIAAPGVPFLRAVEVQVLDHGYNAQGKNEWYTTHGDVFPIHGSSMKPFGRHNGQRSFPSEERSKPSPEWNHYRIVCTNGVIRLHVNGREVSGGEDCIYRKGYIGLESEGSPVQFRNLRLKELPASGAGAELRAPIDAGWKPLFTGLDLRGWKTNEAVLKRWQVAGERLSLRAGAALPDAALLTERTFGNAEFIIDCRPPQEEPRDNSKPSIQFRGASIDLDPVEPGKYSRTSIRIEGSRVTIETAGKLPRHMTLPANAPERDSFGVRDSGAAHEFMNLYAREI